MKYCESNSPPAGLREIPEEEFARSLFFTYNPVRTEYRQILPDALCGTGVKPPTTGERCGYSRPMMMPLYMYWFHNHTGIGITADHAAGKVRYFWFGACDHSDTTHRSAGHCEHEYTCNQCGYKYGVDSSG